MTSVSHKGLTFELLYSEKQLEEVVDRLSKEINEYYQNIFATEG